MYSGKAALLCSCQISTFYLLRSPGKEERANLLALRSKTLLPSATKLGQGNIFRSVCQEFCPRGGGVSAPLHAGIHTHPREHPPPRDQRQTPSSAVHAGKYGQQAVGTHPTGMHTCFVTFMYCEFGVGWGVCRRASSDKSLNRNSVVSRLFLLASSCTCTM